MDEEKPAIFGGMPPIPAFDLSSTAAQLQVKTSETLHVLEIYQRNLSLVLAEFEEFKCEKKAKDVEAAQADTRGAYMQYLALASAFCGKAKAKEDIAECKENRKYKEDEIPGLLRKASAAQKYLSELESSRGRQDRQDNRSHKGKITSVDALQPSITAHLQLNSEEIMRWEAEMKDWAAASEFSDAPKTVQIAFAKKFTEKELHEAVMAKAEEEGIEMDFRMYIEKTKQKFEQTTNMMIRRQHFFLLKSNDNSANGYLKYIATLKKEFHGAKIAELDTPEKFICHRVISELPNHLRGSTEDRRRSDIKRNRGRAGKISKSEDIGR